jgi:alanine dehydrogenase
MPGAVPRTSTFALANATMPHILALADKGWQEACRQDPHLAQGLSTHEGRLLSPAVGEALGLEAEQPEAALA